MTAASQPARLRLFGGVSLDNEQGPIGGRGAQRRRIALLALLAASGRPISRDKLVGYLWQDADTEHARKLLSESLYVIRKALGEDAISVIGDAIRLNTEVVWSDVVEFGRALERGDDEAAVALYRGPFLEGFFINDAIEFDSWVEAERAAFARKRAEALIRLAAAAEARADYSGAASRWRTLVEHDPYNSSYALGLMRALDVAGDRAGALQHARDHALLLRSEFDAEPDPQMEAFAQSLQLTSHAQPPRPQVASSLESTRTSDVTSPVSARPLHTSSRPPATALKRLRSPLWRVAAVAVVVGASVIVLRLTKPTPSQPVATEMGLVAVMPFSVHGAAADLRDGIAHLLSTNIDGAGDLRSVDSHAVLSLMANDRSPIAPRDALTVAARFGAGYFVLGDVTKAGDQLQLSAKLYRAANSAEVTHAVARGAADSLLTLVDQIAEQLLSGQFNVAELAQLAETTTRSPPALRHYLDGEGHYRAGRYDAAVSAFTRAVREDSDFALADYRLSAAAEWNFEFLLARRAAQRALRNSSRLTEQYQPLVRAWSFFLNGNAAGAQRLYESVLALNPSSIEARSGLGEVIVHFNPTRGLPTDEARVEFERVLTLVPAFGEVRYHALEFAARDHHLARFDPLLEGLEATNPQYQSWRTLRAFTWGTVAEQAHALSDLRNAGELAIGIAAARLAAHTHDFEAAHTVARELTRFNRPPQWRAGGHLLLAEIQMARGNWLDAQRELAAAREIEPDWPIEFAALFTLHPAAAPSRDDLLRQQAELLAWKPDRHSPSVTFFLAAHATVHKQLRLYLLGLVAARLNELDTAHNYRRDLERLAGSPESKKFALALSRSLAGHLARARGDRAQAIELLTTATVDAPPEVVMLSPFYSRAHDRFAIADLNRELGNEKEARRWYQSLAEGYDFLYAPAALTRIKKL